MITVQVGKMTPNWQVDLHTLVTNPFDYFAQIFSVLSLSNECK